MCVRVPVCVYICVSVRVHACSCVCVYMCERVSVRACAGMFLCVCACVCALHGCGFPRRRVGLTLPGVVCFPYTFCGPSGSPCSVGFGPQLPGLGRLCPGDGAGPGSRHGASCPCRSCLAELASGTRRASRSQLQLILPALVALLTRASEEQLCLPEARGVLSALTGCGARPWHAESTGGYLVGWRLHPLAPGTQSA